MSRTKIKQIEDYAIRLTLIKPDPWFPTSNRSDVSNRIGNEILKIIYSSEETE